jgi:hypothetical protein
MRTQQQKDNNPIYIVQTHTHIYIKQGKVYHLHNNISISARARSGQQRCVRTKHVHSSERNNLIINNYDIQNK